MAAHGGRAGEKGGSEGGDGGASATLATLHRMSSSGGAPRADARAPMAHDLGARSLPCAPSCLRCRLPGSCCTGVIACGALLVSGSAIREPSNASPS